jgi:hypothetical protein
MAIIKHVIVIPFVICSLKDFFESIACFYVYSHCFLPVVSVFCVLFTVALEDVMTLPLLYSPLVCIFLCCWIC